jgi:hypothetical protein
MKMKDETGKEKIERSALRNPTEATISCRPFTCCGAGNTSDGVMRNFSSEGFYIETPYQYKPGNTLMVRMVRYPAIPPSISEEDRPRSICLAKVEWLQELADEYTTRYGMGLRYIG